MKWWYYPLIFLFLLNLLFSIAGPSHRTYINVDGDEISMPVYTDEQPDDATYLCRNGAYSFSQHRRGACSKEGGVEEEL